MSSPKAQNMESNPFHTSQHSSTSNLVEGDKSSRFSTTSLISDFFELCLAPISSPRCSFSFPYRTLHLPLCALLAPSSRSLCQAHQRVQSEGRWSTKDSWSLLLTHFFQMKHLYHFCTGLTGIFPTVQPIFLLFHFVLFSPCVQKNPFILPNPLVHSFVRSSIPLYLG